MGRHLPGLIGGACSALSLVAVVPIAVVNGYLALVTAVAALRRPALPAGEGSPGALQPAAAPAHRIALLVPAHDEEQIIGETIDSMVGQDYPRALFAVHVVADNCTDGTVAVARAHGAEVHERVDPTAPGKGPALGWLVERIVEGAGSPLPEAPVLKAPLPDAPLPDAPLPDAPLPDAPLPDAPLPDAPLPDAMVIVDADTTLSPGFLRAVDEALAGDGSAWQAFYTVQAPDQSPGTAVRHAALLLRHYVRPLGRTALGASSGLFGNGMAFRTTILRDREFSAHLTEDVEFQLELLLDGTRVGFLPTAVVEAEMPDTLDAARTQNERWELGRIQLARRFVPKLVAGTFRRGTRHRVAHADAALDQLVPPLSVLAAATALVAGAATAVGAVTSGPPGRVARTLSWLSVAALAGHVVGGLAVARAPRATYLALLRAPRVVIWKIGLWLRVLLRPDDVGWSRTQRNAERDVAGPPAPV